MINCLVGALLFRREFRDFPGPAGGTYRLKCGGNHYMTLADSATLQLYERRYR